jgi:signal peptidase
LAFQTKGDANNAPDQRPTMATDVQGVLWYSVPLVGSLRAFLISPAGLCYLAGVLLLMVAGHLLLPSTRPAARAGSNARSSDSVTGVAPLAKR